MSTVASTSSAQPSAARPPATLDGPGVSFVRLLQVELRKLLDTVAGRWVLGAILLITLASLALVAIFTPPEFLSFGTLLQAVSLPQGLLLPVLGVLAATAEWTKRTGLITFTLEPRRIRVAAAKFLAALLLGLITFAIGVALAGATYAILSATRDLPPGESFHTWAFVGTFAVIALSVAQGVGFGMLLGSTPLAIVAIYVLPTALTMVGALWEASRPVMPWIDPSQTQAPLTGGASLSGEQWAQLATSTGLWIVLPIVLGVVVLCRREVK